MKTLWKPIEELKDKYVTNLLIWAPELVDLDFNPSGCGMGHFQDDAGENGAGSWQANSWDGNNDEWTLVNCNPTHYLVMEAPEGAKLEHYRGGEDAKPE